MVAVMRVPEFGPFPEYFHFWRMATLAEAPKLGWSSGSSGPRTDMGIAEGNFCVKHKVVLL